MGPDVRLGCNMIGLMVGNPTGQLFTLPSPNLLFPRGTKEWI